MGNDTTFFYANDSANFLKISSLFQAYIPFSREGKALHATIFSICVGLSYYIAEHKQTGPAPMVRTQWLETSNRGVDFKCKVGCGEVLQFWNRFKCFTDFHFGKQTHMKCIEEIMVNFFNFVTGNPI